MTKKESKYYVLNEDLIPEIQSFKKTCVYDANGKYVPGSGIMSNELGKMVWLIADGLSKKANWCGYTWRESMVSSAILTCIKYLHNFDLEKSDNPFAYISTICNRAFMQYIAYAKRHSKIKKYLWERKPKYFEDNDFYSSISFDYEMIAAYESKEDDE